MNVDDSAALLLGRRSLRELQRILDFEALSKCPTLAGMADLRRDVQDLEPTELMQLVDDAIMLGGRYVEVLSSRAGDDG